ncbi:MAG: hypothetical protein ACYC5M_10715 [Anaerolineae bacterium]
MARDWPPLYQSRLPSQGKQGVVPSTPDSVQNAARKRAGVAGRLVADEAALKEQRKARLWLFAMIAGLAAVAIVFGCIPSSPTKTVSSLSPLEVEQSYYGKTSAQLDAHSRSLAGTRVQWTGRVVDVSSNGLVDLRVSDSTGKGFGFNVTINVPKDTVTRINKGTRITFRADIVTVIYGDSQFPVFRVNVRDREIISIH